MINLVKNELVKIFHKKGIYILSGILVGIMALSLIVSKIDLSSMIEEKYTNTYYDELEENLESYDLNDKDEVMWYVDDKVELEIYKLKKDLKYDSPKYYYIDNELQNVMVNMYNAKYSNKNEAEYEQLKIEYDEMIKNLDDFDWKKSILESKNELDKEKAELVSSLKNATKEEKANIQEEIDNLGYQINALNYRLNNDVAPSYTNASYMVDNYVSAAMSYSSLNKDESAYKDRKELIRKREIIKEYNEVKYKIENNIVPKNSVTLQYEASSLFGQTDMIVLIAFLIIAGGIIAEEFNKGTIKQLLLRPFTRSQILVSKIIAAVIATFIFACFYYFMDLLIVGLMNNEFKSIFEPMIVYNFKTESVVEYSTFTYCLLNILATLPEYFLMFAICILVGILTTNTVACVISIFGVDFLNGLLSAFLPEKIAAFMPTNCMNFVEYLFGGISSNKYQTLLSSSIVYVVTLVVIVTISFVVFKKKDIKNQ